MKPLKIQVYELFRNGELFYVGCTCQFKVRLRQHRVAHGDDIEGRVVATFDNYEDGSEYEFKRIQQRLAEGVKLINIVTGRSKLSHDPDAYARIFRESNRRGAETRKERYTDEERSAIGRKAWETITENFTPEQIAEQRARGGHATAAKRRAVSSAE